MIPIRRPCVRCEPQAGYVDFLIVLCAEVDFSEKTTDQKPVEGFLAVGAKRTFIFLGQETEQTDCRDGHVQLEVEFL